MPYIPGTTGTGSFVSVRYNALYAVMMQTGCTNVLVVTVMCMYFAPSLIQGHLKDMVSLGCAQAAKEMHYQGYLVTDYHRPHRLRKKKVRLHLALHLYLQILDRRLKNLNHCPDHQVQGVGL